VNDNLGDRLSQDNKSIGFLKPRIASNTAPGGRAATWRTDCWFSAAAERAVRDQARRGEVDISRMNTVSVSVRRTPCRPCDRVHATALLAWVLCACTPERALQAAQQAFVTDRSSGRKLPSTQSPTATRIAPPFRSVSVAVSPSPLTPGLPLADWLLSLRGPFPLPIAGATTRDTPLSAVAVVTCPTQMSTAVQLCHAPASGTVLVDGAGRRLKKSLARP
jgi:hypothetical protein